MSAVQPFQFEPERTVGLNQENNTVSVRQLLVNAKREQPRLL